jgi:hypothetical protein
MWRGVCGADPWSARVPLDPPSHARIHHLAGEEPTRGSAADQGVRPTICAPQRAEACATPALTRNLLAAL